MEVPWEVEDMRKGGFCTDCVHLPCLCSLVKAELKILSIRTEESEPEKAEIRKRKRDEEEEEEVDQQDSQPAVGGSAVQLEGVGQQLHQQVIDGGAAAPHTVGETDIKDDEKLKPPMKDSKLKRRDETTKKRKIASRNYHPTKG